MLEIGNPSQAASRLDDDEKGNIRNPDVTSAGGNPNITIINESGLYSLILTSRKPEATGVHTIDTPGQAAGGWITYTSRGGITIRDPIPGSDGRLTPGRHVRFRLSVRSVSGRLKVDAWRNGP